MLIHIGWVAVKELWERLWRGEGMIVAEVRHSDRSRMYTLVEPGETAREVVIDGHIPPRLSSLAAYRELILKV